MPYTAPNRLSVGVQTPNVDVSNFVVRPMDTLAAMDAGRRVASNTIDEIMVRPKTRRAEVAKAEADILAAPAEGLARKDVANAQAGAAYDAEKRRTDPFYDLKRIKANQAAYQYDLDDADEKLKRDLTPKPGEAPLTKEKQEQIAEKWKKDRANAAYELSLLKDSEKVWLANHSGNVKKAEAESTRAATDSDRATAESGMLPQQVRVANQALETAVRQGDFNLGQLDLRNAATGIDDAIALRQRQTQEQIINNPATQAAQIQTAAVGAQVALKQAERELQILSGSAGSQPITAATEKVLGDYGLSPIDPSTGQPYTNARAADVIRVEKNKKDATKPMERLQESAAGSEAIGDAAKRVFNIAGTVSTGALYGLPGVTQVDRVLAQFGFEDSQARERLTADAMTFVADVRKNFPGQVSNYEMALYDRAVPSAKSSPGTNKALALAMLATSRRSKEQLDFFQRNVGNKSYAEVAADWGKYTDMNPVLREDPSGVPTFNASRLSPEEWEFARSGKENAKKIMGDKINELTATPGAMASLPRGNRVGNQILGQESDPFVVVDKQILPNDAYWKPALR